MTMYISVCLGVCRSYAQLSVCLCNCMALACNYVCFRRVVDFCPSWVVCNPIFLANLSSSFNCRDATQIYMELLRLKLSGS